MIRLVDEPPILEPDASALDADRCRRRPPGSLLAPARHVPDPVLPADDEGGGLEVRDNHDAMRLIEQVLRNPLVGRRHRLREHRRRVVQPLGRVVVSRPHRRDRGRGRHRHRHDCCHDPSHCAPSFWHCRRSGRHDDVVLGAVTDRALHASSVLRAREARRRSSTTVLSDASGGRTGQVFNRGHPTVAEISDCTASGIAIGKYSPRGRDRSWSPVASHQGLGISTAPTFTQDTRRFHAQVVECRRGQPGAGARVLPHGDGVASR